MRYALLDPLRGLAALWVFLYHYEFSTPFRAHAPFLHSVFKQGYLGVPMFFVISGFCLTASARSSIARSESATSFLRRRFRRIYPPFWCSLLVVVAIPFLIEGISSLKSGVYLPPTSAGNPSLGYLDFSAFEWIRVATLTKVFDPPGAEFGLQGKFNKLNAVFWTLAVEVQFYAVVAVALAYRRRFYGTLAAATLVSIPFFFLPATYGNGIFLPYWPMFAVGVGIYAGFENGWSPTRRFGRFQVPICSLVVIGTVVAYLGMVRAGIGMTPFRMASLFGLAVWFGQGLDDRFVALATGARAILRWPIALWNVVGAMSYSIYLLHAKLHYLVAQLARQILATDTIVFDLVVLTTTVALCYPFYLCCEVPFFKPTAKKREIPTEVREPAAVA